MKKYWKLSTVILAASMLLSGGGVFLLINSNTSQTNNQALLNSFSKDQQSDNVQIVNSVNDINFVGSKYNSMFAIIKDINGDRVYAWGQNSDGQLGVEGGNTIYTPKLIKNSWETKSVTHVLSGGNFSLIVLDNKEIWASGRNDYGQFGNGVISGNAVSEFKWAYTFDKNITSISTGFTHAAAIVDDKLYTWGRNHRGQLGIGTRFVNLSVPTEIKSTLNGTKKEVLAFGMCTALLTDNSGADNLYLGGDSLGGYLGVGNDYITTFTLLNFSFPGGISSFSGGYKIYPTILVATNNNQLYAWGGHWDTMGINETTSPTIVPELSGKKINQINLGGWVATLLTDEGVMYGMGKKDFNGHGVDSKKFTQIKDWTGISKTWGLGGTAFLIINDLIYAWGNNGGEYGNGNTTASPTPTLVDPFSAPSSLVQKTKQDNTKTAQTVAEEIYSAGVFKETAFNAYVEKKGFFADTTFTMTSAPTVNVPKGEIKCTVQTDKSYSLPDGAKSLNAASFEITLTGFKVPADSNIDNTGLIVGLSIGGILLLLIIIGLVIWYLKRKNKYGAIDNKTVLY